MAKKKTGKEERKEEEKLKKEKEKKGKEKNKDKLEKKDSKKDIEKVNPPKPSKNSSDSKSPKDPAEEGFEKSQKQSEKETIRTLILIISFMVVGFSAVIIFFNSSNTLEHNGVEYERINVGDLLFYRTSFLAMNEEGEETNYKIYIRNNPKTLFKDVPYEGNLSLRKNVVINFKDNFDCNGMGSVAIGSLERMGIFGLNILQDNTVGCSPSGEYASLIFEAGNETKIEQVDDYCYEISVNGCEIVPATERFMIEVFIKVNENLD